MPRLEPYSRKLSYSYALGLFPCMKLMEAHPEAAKRLLLHPDALNAPSAHAIHDTRVTPGAHATPSAGHTAPSAGQAASASGYTAPSAAQATPAVGHTIPVAGGERSEQKADFSGVEKLRLLCRERGIREEIAEKVLKRESKKDNCFAGLVFEKYHSALKGDANHAVLCQISDSGNLGTALRSLLGFGFQDVALIKPCVDPFEPRALRASMGAIFDLRLWEYENFDQYRAEFPGRRLYPFMLDGARPLEEVARGAEGPYTLVFGNEQRGLPAEFQQYGQSVLIPQTDKIDSLNLAVAVSIGAYAFANGGKKP